MAGRQHNIAGYRDFTEAFITKLELKKPVLLGHSFGSIVVAAVAAQSPKLISKLVLVNPIASPPSGAVLVKLADFYYWLGHKLPESAGRALLGNPLIVRFTTIALARTRDKQVRQLIHQNHLNYFSTFQTRSALNQAYKAGTTHTATEFAAQIAMPTLQIVGEQDNVAPLTGQHILAGKLAKNTFVALPNVGHLVHYEQPAEAARAIKKFLQ